MIYFTNHDVGGISGLYHKLTTAAIFKPLTGNSGGAFLTIASSGAQIFGIINIVGNFGKIEWTNDAEDSIDDELAMKIEETVRRMLSSILIKIDIYKCERIVKLGDPVSKSIEVEEKNHAEMIILEHVD